MTNGSENSDNHKSQTADQTPSHKGDPRSIEEKLEEAKLRLMEQQQLNGHTSSKYTSTKKFEYDQNKKFVRIDVKEEGCEDYAYFEPQPEVRNVQENSLLSCLYHFTKNEEMKDPQNLYHCESCTEEKYGKNTKRSVLTFAMRRFMLYELPESMIINLKRFSHVGMSLKKNSKPIEVEKRIEMDDFMIHKGKCDLSNFQSPNLEHRK